MTLTLQPTPDPIDEVAEQIATTVFGTTWDATERALLKRQLLVFAALIQRMGGAA